MRFFHTADIHLGCRPDRGTAWASEREGDIPCAFAALINACREQSPDLLLIAGDLFHREPSAAELKEAASYFAEIPQVRVVMIAGNHDFIRSGSAYERFEWPKNVTFLKDRELSGAVFEDLGVAVHGFSYHSREINEPLYDGLKAPKDGLMHILLAHGGDAGHIPFSRAALSQSGFDYIAFGHLHKPQISVQDRIAFCGSLSPIDPAETGERGYVSGELRPDGKMSALKLDFVPVPSRRYIPCRINVTERTTNRSLQNTFAKFTAAYGIENIYKLTLTGERDPDIVFEEAPLLSAGHVISFADKTIPAYHTEKLLAEHKNDIIGDFISAFTETGDISAITDPVKKQALLYGLEALLSNYDAKGGAL